MNAIFTAISMDFITGLTKSNGNEVIFVAVDQLRKYSHFVALNHPFTVTSVAEMFLSNVYKLHVMPSRIVSDRDSVFFSNLWQ